MSTWTTDSYNKIVANDWSDTLMPTNAYGGYTISTDTTVQNAITITTGSGDKVSLSFEMLLDLKLLLDEINELPPTHPLADLKQGLTVRKALRTLGKE